MLLITFLHVLTHFLLTRPRAARPHSTHHPPPHHGGKCLRRATMGHRSNRARLAMTAKPAKPLRVIDSRIVAHSSCDRTFVHTGSSTSFSTQIVHYSGGTYKEVGGMSIAHPTHCVPSGADAPQGCFVISGYDALRPRETDPRSRRFQPGRPDQPHRYRSSPAAERAKELPKASEQGSKAWPTGSGSEPQRWSGSASRPDHRSA